MLRCLSCDDGDLLAAVRTDEAGDGGLPALRDCLALRGQGHLRHDGLDRGVQGVGDPLEVPEGDVATEVITDVLLGDTELVRDVHLRHAPLLEDEVDVFLDVHNSNCVGVKICCKGNNKF